MKTKLFSGSKRTKLFTFITIFGIIVILVLNFLLSVLTKSNALYIDTSFEKLYTVTDRMKSECKEIFDKLDGDDKVRITFCTDPDYLMNSETTRLSYVLAQKLAKMYPDSVELVTVNAVMNPTAVSEYKTTSLSEIAASDIIVSYGGRYRITPAARFWVSGTENSKYFNGEYRFATLIRSVTAIDMPAAYFVTDHGESYYDESDPESQMSLELYEFYNLLLSRGLSVKTLDLSSVERIPDDCALLIINDPREDFSYDADKLDQISYVSDIEKLDRYLVMKQGAVMVAKDYANELPVFESFLKSWGFSFGSSLVKDDENSLTDEGKTGTALITTLDKDENSYGYAIYGEFADLSSAPVTVIENSGSIECTFPEELGGTVNEQGSSDSKRTYLPFLTSGSTAKLYSWNGSDNAYTDLAGAEKAYHLAAVSVRSQINPESAEHKYSYLFCVNSPDFLKGKFLAASSSYANYDIVSALVDNISRIDDHAHIDLGGTSLNSLSGGGKKLITTSLFESGKRIYSNKYKNDDKNQGLIVIKEAKGISSGEIGLISALVFLPAAAMLISGITVCIKRRFL